MYSLRGDDLVRGGDQIVAAVVAESRRQRPFVPFPILAERREYIPSLHNCIGA